MSSSIILYKTKSITFFKPYNQNGAAGVPMPMKFEKPDQELESTERA